MGIQLAYPQHGYSIGIRFPRKEQFIAEKVALLLCSASPWLLEKPPSNA